MSALNYRSSPSKAVICDVCGQGPGPNGILGWIFDVNFVSCLECRKPAKEVSTKEMVPLPEEKRNFFSRLRSLFFK